MTQTRSLEWIIIVLKQQKSWSEKDPMNKTETAGISRKPETEAPEVREESLRNTLSDRTRKTRPVNGQMFPFVREQFYFLIHPVTIIKSLLQDSVTWN